LNFKNTTKQKLKEGKACVGFFLTHASYDWAELLSRIGFDWLLLDMEHGSIHFDMLPWVLAATSGGVATPLVRIPFNDPVYVKMALDSGAQGIMFPQINSKEDATLAVKACRYPPTGIRGVGPRRASLYYTELFDYMKTADQEVMTIVQIETKEAVDHIDEILSVSGLDAAFIGPMDLSASMGYLNSFPKIEKEVANAIATVLEACGKHNVAPGIWGSAENANEHIKRGFRLVVLGADTDYMAKVKEDLQKIKKI
jgi:2-dehydro-3-deoxyglucarate aldolase/4-hydroxy-2-oxoheptanedioate aldolase